MPLRRSTLRVPSLLAALLAFGSALPAVQWCAGPWPAITPEQLAACAIAEYSGCRTAACGSANACETAAPASACDAEPAGTMCGAATSPCAAPSGDDSAADDAAIATAFLPGTAERAAEGGEPARDASPDGPVSRAFCVGNPIGGVGVRPALDLDPAPLAIVATLVALDPPAPATLPRAAATIERPPLPPAPATAPIRGPPAA